MTEGKTSFIIMPYTKGFKHLLESVEDTYLGKPVKKKYQKRYGKIYDEDEIKPLAFTIAKSHNIKIDKGGRR